MITFILVCLLSISSSLYSMQIQQKEPIAAELLEAVKDSDVQKVKELVNYICKPGQNYRTFDTCKHLLDRSTIDISTAFELVNKRLKQKKQSASSICNYHFFKNVGISIACLLSSFGLTAAIIYDHTKNEAFDIAKDGICLPASAGGMAVFGIRHLAKACTNEDAINDYTRQLAIKSLLEKIESHSLETV